MNHQWPGMPMDDPPKWLRELLGEPPWGSVYPMGVCEDCLLYGPMRFRSPVDNGTRCARCTVAWYDAQHVTDIPRDEVAAP